MTRADAGCAVGWVCGIALILMCQPDSTGEQMDYGFGVFGGVLVGAAIALFAVDLGRRLRRNRERT